MRLQRYDNPNKEILETLRKCDGICFPGDDLYNFTKTKSVHWLATEDREPIAYCSLEYMDKHSMFLSRSGVLPGHRGHGFQKRMIDKRIKYCKENNVWCLMTYTTPCNWQSMNNLIKCGFKVYEPEYKIFTTDRELIYWRKILDKRFIW